MKKISHFLVAFVLFLTSVITLSACGKDEITKASVISGLPARIVLDEDLDTSNVVVKVTYDNDDTKTFSSSELDFDLENFDNSSAGFQDLTITIKSEDYSFTYSIEVVATEADVNAINKLESKLIKEFRSNKNLVPSEKYGAEETNYAEGFYDREQPLYVGDDNDFHFDLSVSGVDGMGELVENISSVRTKVTVKQWKNSDWVTLEGNDLTNMVSINYINAILNFTEDAVGEKFRITVTAANPDTDYEESQYTFTEDVCVTDGFNVYDIDDLSVFDNFNQGWAGAHNRIKAKYGLTDAQLANVRAVILQKDIELLAPYAEVVEPEKGEVVARTLITLNENNAHKYVRADAFWNGKEEDFNETQLLTDQVLRGTPYNSSRAGIFRRQIADGKSFDVIGNYFTINATKMPKMVEAYGAGVVLDNTWNEDKGVWEVGDEASYIHSFTTLFYTENIEKDYDEVKEAGTHITDANTLITYKNLAFSGNGAMSQDPRNSGALSFMKNREVNFYAYNTVSYNFHTSYTFELGKVAVDSDKSGEIEDDELNAGDGNYVIEKCRTYNSYQTFINLWGAENTTIIDCDFRNAGGPGILADSVHLGERGQDDFDKAYYLDGTWEGDDLKAGYNTEYVAGPIVNIVDTNIISKATGKEAWYSSNDANILIQMLTMFDQFFDGTYNDDNLDVDAGYARQDKSFIAGTKKDNETDVPVMDFTAVLGRFQPVEGIMTENTAKLQGAILTFDTLEDYYKYYGLEGRAIEKTTNGLDLGRMGYLASLAYEPYGLPIFESASTGAFAATPLGQSGPVTAGLQTGKTIAKQVLEGTYAGLYDYLPQKPCTKEQFAALDNATKLATLHGILDAIVAMDNASYYDQTYAGIKDYCPIFNWDELTSVADKCAAVKQALADCVARGEASPMAGRYINLYLPGLGGYMGVVMGSYNRPAQQN